MNAPLSKAVVLDDLTARLAARRRARHRLWLIQQRLARLRPSAAV